jgi:hypothetical protein
VNEVVVLLLMMCLLVLIMNGISNMQVMRMLLIHGLILLLVHVRVVHKMTMLICIRRHTDIRLVHSGSCVDTFVKVLMVLLLLSTTRLLLVQSFS